MPFDRVGPGDWTRAVADTEGPQIVLAGPGAGKTEFLVRRATHLICQELVEPDQLLVLTFSRRAASDLRTRIEEQLRRTMVQIPASTFHSFCYRLLEYLGPDAAGWSRIPTILTGPEQVAFVASLLSSERPDRWPASYRALLSTRTLAEEVAEFILRARERLLGVADLRRLAAERAGWRALPDFMVRYDQALIEHHRIDYGTLQASAVRLLEDRQIRLATAGRYRYVLVDEYQDTTLAQARLLGQLSGHSGNLTVAADARQSIFGFRGAFPENVDEFTVRFPDSTSIVLDQSFRVPGPILDAAERLMEASPVRLPSPDLHPARHAGSVEVYVFDQHSHEAEWIASEVQRIHLSEGVPYRGIAVLVRTKRRLLTELSRTLDRRGIPHDEPQSRLADTTAVRALLDCVEASDLEARAKEADGPGAEILRQAADGALARILFGPLFGIPLGIHRELARARSRSANSWPAVVRGLVPDGEGLAELLGDDTWVRRVPADEGFWIWWTSLPQLAQFVEQPDATEQRAAWSSLAQVLDRLVEREPATTLLDYASLAQQEDFEATPLLSYRRLDKDRVTLATLHQSKGLEFEVVFIADAVEGVFPDLRRERSILQSHLLGIPEPPSGSEATMARLAEEIRLAYVGMTRASARVVWTATLAGINESQTRPSRFLPIAAGTGTVAELPGPPTARVPAVTRRAAEAALRRILTDPAQFPARRIGAAAVLASSQELRPPLEFTGVRAAGPDHGLTPDEVRLSPSQADVYERCPLRYALSRRLRLSNDETVYARFGSLIHEVLETVETAAIERGDDRSSLAEAAAELDRRFGDYDFGPPGPGRAWHRRGVECLEELYRHWPDGRARPISLEKELRLELEGTKWLGFADRIEELEDGSFRIVDYKTGKRVPPVDELKLQLGYYVLAARSDSKLGPDVRGAQAWYPLARGRLAVRELQASDLADVRARLVEIAAGIKSENWEPRPHEGCERCPVRILCPEWPEGQEAFVR